MNRTKFWLILVAIIFSFVSIGWDIYDIVMFFLTEPQNRIPVFYCVYYFIEIVALLAVAVLLTMAIWKNGKMFRQRHGYYMTAIVLSIIISLFSVTSILLIISMFISDWVWIKEDKLNNEKVVNISDTREEKIAKLRRKRENGEITEEEFQEEIMKLL